MEVRQTDERQLKRDARALRRFARDVLDLIDDVESRRAGREVWYAVDFTEVYSWALQGGKGGGERLKLFDDDEPDFLRQLQEAVLHFIFYDHQLPRPIMLPSHATELQAHLRRWHLQDLGRMPVALPRNEEIALIASRFQPNENGDPTEAERQAFFQYAFEHSGELLAFWQRHQDQPAERVARLLEEERLSSVDALGCLGLDMDLLQLSPDFDRYRSWKSRLDGHPVRRRDTGEGSNEADARAMMTLEALDEYLNRLNANVEVCFITRSQAMHRIYQQDFRDRSNPWRGQRSERRRWLLRHPRAFILLKAASGESLDDVLVRLRTLERGLRLFASEAFPDMDWTTLAYGPYDNEIRPRLWRSATLIERLILDIKNEWRAKAKGIVLETIAASRQSDDALRVGSPDEAFADSVLRALRHPKLGVLSLLRDQQKLANQRFSTAWGLAGVLARTPAALHDVTEQAPQVERDHQALLSIDADRYTVAFLLNFHSDSLRHWADSVARTRRIEFAATFDLFDQLLDEEPVDTERLLAVAYYFAAWNRWDDAIAWVRLACDVPNVDPARSVENNLFLALCLRKTSFASDGPESRFERAIEAIEQAFLFARISGSADDPRLHLEYATQLSYWADKIPAVRVRGDDLDWHTAEALRLLETHPLPYEEDRIRSILRAHNNRCYAILRRVWDGEEASRSAAQASYDRMIDLMPKARWHFPPSVAQQATVQLGRWVLRPAGMSEAEIRALADDVIAQFSPLMAGATAIERTSFQGQIDRIRLERDRPLGGATAA